MNRVRMGGMIVGCLLALAAVGCTGGGGGGSTNSAPAADAPVKPEFRYRVVADTADFFHISPQQVAGADEKLKRDTRVTLLKRYGGYSQIQTPGGVSGYVASDEIARLSPQEVAEEDASVLAKQAPPGSLAPLVSGPGGTYSIPPEATHETVLPVPDATPAAGAKATPNPMFRY